MNKSERRVRKWARDHPLEANHSGLSALLAELYAKRKRDDGYERCEACGKWEVINRMASDGYGCYVHKRCQR